MTVGLEFGLLGPLLVVRDGRVLPIPAGHQRALLAALLLNGGRLMSAAELIEVLWGADPPESARASLQNYVKRLRQALGDADHSRILTQPRGYAISVDSGELDVSRFETLLGVARTASRAGAWDQAALAAQAALALWRGDPLADVQSQALAQREVSRLTELLLQALEARLDADLHLGGHADVISELKRLVGAHPLREHLHVLLMLALYRSGRQAEALAAYRDARQVLVAELGAEPGTELRELHGQILNADPALAGPASAPPGADGPIPAGPRALPSAVRHFAGRENELTTLTSLLDQIGDQAPGMVVISAIGGTAGVGKTALAVHWAHQVAECFPDGQLYVDLRGFDPGPPMLAADALAGFLRALGLRGWEIPAEADERAACYRSLLAGRRMLVLLDNAGSVEQVRPLLPATDGCMALITSRDALAGLVARDGARRLELDLLTSPDAAGLLRTLIGERAVADPDATQALAGQCSRLPLALRVAAERTTARPAVALADLVAELADERQRLDLLDAGGDVRTAVRTVFSWSYRHLDPAAARAFRLTALHPGPDLDAYAAAALIGTSLEQARHLLGQLARAYLIQPSGPTREGRYGRHDLLRAYARELTAAQETEDEWRAALTRLFDHYLFAAAAAANTLYPADRQRRPRIPQPDTPSPPMTTAASAQAWLDAERPGLIAMAIHTAAHGWSGHTVQLAEILFRFLDTAGHFPEAVTIHTCACRAARGAGDRDAEAEALTHLSNVDLRQGRHRQAARLLRQALALFRETGNMSGEASVRHNRGIIAMQYGRHQQATRQFEIAETLFLQTGDQPGQGRALGNLGILAMIRGRYEQAVSYQRQALILLRATGDRSGEAYVLSILGKIEGRRGNYELAVGHLQQALSLFREIGDRSGAGYALTYLGDAALRRGRGQSATDLYRQAVALFRETGNPAGQAEALNGLGEALLAAGRLAAARAHLQDALGLAGQLGDTYEQARALHGLGRVWHALGDSGQARDQWRRALTLYVRLDAPEADQIRAELARAPRSGVSLVI